MRERERERERGKEREGKRERERERERGGGKVWLTCLIERFLHFVLELCPVTGSHGRVFQGLDQRHGPLELLDFSLGMIANLPTLVLNTKFNENATKRTINGQ